MDLFEMSRLIAEQKRSGRSYLEFLRIPSLSAGLYVLSAGATDAQQPHTEDELYYVVSGRGTVRVGAEERAVAEGTLILVKAGVPHHFHTITEELKLLVFFAPAEGSHA